MGDEKARARHYSYEGVCASVGLDRVRGAVCWARGVDGRFRWDVPDIPGNLWVEKALILRRVTDWDAGDGPGDTSPTTSPQPGERPQPILGSGALASDER
jgi:hypothetical protein